MEKYKVLDRKKDVSVQDFKNRKDLERAVSAVQLWVLSEVKAKIIGEDVAWLVHVVSDKLGEWRRDED